MAELFSSIIECNNKSYLKKQRLDAQKCTEIK